MTLAAMLIHAVPGAAQSRLEVTPFVGLYTPAFTVSPSALGPTGGPASYRQESGVAFGGRLTEVVTERIALELSLAYARSSVEYATGDAPTSIRLWSIRVLAGVKTPRQQGTSVYAIVGGALAVHPGAEYLPQQEYHSFAAGAVVGFGLRRRMGRLFALRAAVEDYLYPLQGKSTLLQNDFVISIGPSFVVETL